MRLGTAGSGKCSAPPGRLALEALCCPISGQLYWLVGCWTGARSAARWRLRGLREPPPPKEPRNLWRVHCIVGGRAARHRFPGERLAQHNSNSLTGTEVGEPIPGNNTRDRHDERIPLGGNGREQRLWTRGHVARQHARAMGGKHTDVHGPGMQINATIKLGLCRGESPEVSSSL
jgi:hypothetical protein